MTELEARKRALVTESELCREGLKAEFHNLQLQAEALFHKVDRVKSVAPWFMLAGPVAIPLIRMLFGRRAKEERAAPAKGAFATALVALNLFRKYGPIVRGLVSRFQTKRHSAAESHSHVENS